MAEMEDRLNSILSNPQMMQQIMSMAQTLGQNQSESPLKQDEHKPEPSHAPSLPTGIDLSTLKNLTGIMRQSGIDKNQQALLKALNPYLSKDRIVKLENAMRAAKMAGLVSTVLGNSGQTFLFGR